MLADKMNQANARCWLVNTGWTGGAFGTGKRFPLSVTRKIIDSIHDGSLAQASFSKTAVFNLSIPAALNGVDSQLLDPSKSWQSKAAYDEAVVQLAGMFDDAFQRYAADCSSAVRAAGPKV